MRQKVFTIFITTLMVLFLSSCIAVKVSNSNVELNETETTAVSTENDSFDTTTSDSSELPTIEEIADANNVSKLIEKYGTVKVNQFEHDQGIDYTDVNYIYKEDGEYVFYDFWIIFNQVKYRYILYKDASMWCDDQMDGENYQIQLYLASSMNKNVIDTKTCFDEHIFRISEHSTYTVSDDGEDFKIKEKYADGQCTREYKVKKDDLRIYECLDNDAYGDLGYLVTYEYGITIDKPDFLNELDGKKRTVTLIYNYGQSDEHIDKFEVPVKWDVEGIYDIEVSAYSDKEYTTCYYYPGDDIDFTVYVKPKY